MNYIERFTEDFHYASSRSNKEITHATMNPEFRYALQKEAEAYSNPKPNGWKMEEYKGIRLLISNDLTPLQIIFSHTP